MRRFAAGAIPLVLAILILAAPAFAGTTGKLVGRVVDQNGLPVIGANVVIDGTSRGTTTDLDGEYYLIGVTPGEYAVTASYVGYQTVRKTGVLVKVDRTVTVDFQLTATSIQLEEAVLVVDRSETIQRDQTATRKNVTSEDFDILPAETVNQVLRLQAGVSSTGGLHIRGGRSGELMYMIDGHKVVEPLFGGRSTDLNAEAIEQMELLTGTFNAEYGNAMSGVVNIVTRENTEQLRGKVRYKRSNLGLEDESDLLNENYLEGSVSGPISSRLNAGFLLSGRYIREDSYLEAGAMVPEYDDNGNYVRDVPGYQGSGDAFGWDDSENLFAKVHFDPTENTKLALSYTYDHRNWQSYVHSYKYIPDSAYVRDELGNLFALNFTHTLSRDLFYELRLSHNRYDYVKDYDDLFWTEYSAGNGTRYEGEFRLESANQEYIEQASVTNTGRLDVNYQYNKYNLFKAGAELKQHDVDYFWIFSPRRSPDQRYLNDYNKQPWEVAAYLQDKIEFETIILNLGLRLDAYNSAVDEFIVDPNDPSVTDESETKLQVSPRLGIAYPVTDRMVFHFAYGHFFQRPDFEILYEDLQRRLTVNRPLIGDPNLDPQKTVSYELGVDWEAFEGGTFQATVFSKKIQDLVGVVWQFKVPGVPVAYAYNTNEDFAYVKGIELSSKIRRGVLSAGLNYTYSIAEGSSSSQQERYLGAFDVAGRQSLQFYPLSFDRPHVFNAYAAATFGEDDGPWGFAPAVFENTTASLLVEASSGRAFTYNPTRKRYEPDLNNDRMEAEYNVDLEIEKWWPVAGNVRVGAFLQVYNLTDRRNVISVYSFTGEPDDDGASEGSYEYINDPLNYSAPRTIFLGAAISF